MNDKPFLKSKTNANSTAATVTAALSGFALAQGVDPELVGLVQAAVLAVTGLVGWYLRRKPGEQGRTYPEAVG